MGKKVAIVGSGVSGIGALWALKSTDHEVHLFEQSSRLGGHTNTVDFQGPGGDKTRVDTGFMVINTVTYPNFIAFLKHLGIPTKKTEMTFSVSRDQGSFEWGASSLSSIFAQKRNFFTFRIWRLIFDIIRFNQFAIDVLRYEDESENDPSVQHNVNGSRKPAQESIGDYLDREGYSQAFRDDYLIPMTASVWSTSPDKASLQFPAITLIRFMWNHHLLNTLSKRPDWITIPGGTYQYIEAVLKDFPQSRIHIKSKVLAATSTPTGSVILNVNGKDQEFDHVVLATHGNQALEILQPTATKKEVEILRNFQTSRNIIVLHSDKSLMPKRRAAWTCWNYLTESPFPHSGQSNVSKICLTYFMNQLQHISEHKFGPVLATMNPLTMPDPRLAQGIWEYSHPLYNAAAIKSQQLLPTIQNTRNISYCGAWTKYGFHEDGFSSGISIAMNHLDAKLPFEFVDSTFSRGRRPVLTVKNHLVRIVILCINLVVVLMVRFFAALGVYLDKSVAKRRKLA